MKYTIVLTIILGAFALVFALPLNEVPNFQHPQFAVYTSGQPTEEGFRQLSAMGIKTVINVLPEKECLAEEQGMVTANHMVYLTVPFSLSGFSRETVDHFAEVMNTVEKPVLIHCSTGNHAGGLWFAYRVLSQGAPVWLALKEGRQIGMTPYLEDFLFPWVVQQNGQKGS